MCSKTRQDSSILDKLDACENLVWDLVFISFRKFELSTFWSLRSFRKCDLKVFTNSNATPKYGTGLALVARWVAAGRRTLCVAGVALW